MKPPICPECGKAECVWESSIEDWIICEDCRAKREERKREAECVRQWEALDFPKKYWKYEPNDFQRAYLRKLSAKRGYKITNPDPVGKTTLLRLIQREALRRGRSAAYHAFISLPELYMRRDKTDEWRSLERVDVLLIDDFGDGAKCAWFSGIFHELLTRRQESERHTSFVVRDLNFLGPGVANEIKLLTVGNATC